MMWYLIQEPGRMPALCHRILGDTGALAGLWGDLGDS